MREVRDMWLAGKARDVIDVNLRNQYPPFVADMRGAMRGLAIYAWEESGFPERYVTEFNSTLNLITVPSRFVAKVLRDNGVHAPIRVVGEGCDHVLDAVASDWAAEPEARPFRFLHVSSCFPRKAVDVLLAAWVKAFSDADPVELVIKTFPNEHNRIEDILAAIKTAHPRHAPISLINRDIELEELRRIVSRCRRRGLRVARRRIRLAVGGGDGAWQAGDRYGLRRANGFLYAANRVAVRLFLCLCAHTSCGREFGLDRAGRGLAS